MAPWQTALYKARKGKQAWQLEADFLKKLRLALSELTPVEFEGVMTLPSLQIPLEEIRKHIVPKINKETQSDSIASQIGQKYKDLTASFRPEITKTALLVRPKNYREIETRAEEAEG